MSIKNLVMVASMLLAFGSVSAFAASHEKAEGTEAETMECITQEALDAMSDEDKAKVEAPICEEGAATEESSEEKKAD